MPKLKHYLILTLVALSFFHSKANSAEIITSIKPIYYLVSSVVGNTKKVSLMLDSLQSPHQYTLKPSNISEISNAKIIFYIDDDFETFLTKTLNNNKNIIKVPFVQQKGIKILPIRRGNNWEEDEHDDEEDDHDEHHHHGDNDDHIWLSPNNAIKMAQIIQDELSKLYPENAELYKQNTNKLIARINNITEENRAKMQKLESKRFVVFHDAYQYFENYYNLSAVGSIVLEPNKPISANRLSTVNSKIDKYQVQCIFKEPEFSSKAINIILEERNIAVYSIDPIGYDSTSYEDFLQNIANSFYECLNSK